MLKDAQMKICKSIFVLIIGVSSVHAAGTPVKKSEIVRERERILKDLITTVYYGAPLTWKSSLFLRNTKIITEGLQIHFQTCPLYDEDVKTMCDNQPSEEDKQRCINKAQGDTGGTHLDDLVQTLKRISENELQAYLMNLRCDYIIKDLSSGYFASTRRQVQNVIFELSGNGRIDKGRRDTLLFYLDEFYGPDMPHMQEEREALIAHFQSCDYNSGMLDRAWHWISDVTGNPVIKCEAVIRTAQEQGITYLDVRETLNIALTFLSVNKN